MNNKTILKKVADEMNLDYKLVHKVYYDYWKFIKNQIEQLPLKEDITEETFNSLKTNFNISSIGHLTCYYRRILNIKNKNERNQSTKSKT